jgi:hypothetical protein
MALDGGTQFSVEFMLMNPPDTKRLHDHLAVLQAR